jgi:phage FluMu protein Com
MAKPTFCQCPHCKEVSTVGEWNVETYKLCTSRETKRSYVRIQDAGKRPKWYVCPKCKKDSKIDQIVPVLKSEFEKEKADDQKGIS